MQSIAPSRAVKRRAYKASSTLLRATLLTLWAFTISCHPHASESGAADRPPLEALQEGITQAPPALPSLAAPTPRSTPAPKLPPPPQEPDEGAGVHPAKAFDLLANRPLAHRRYQRDDLIAFGLEASSPDFVRYILGNHADQWRLEQEIDDEPAAIINGRRATLAFPAWSTQGHQRLTMRLHHPKNNEGKVKLRINGKRLATATLKPGWQEVSWEFNAQNILRPENELTLEFEQDGTYAKQRSGGALKWLWLGDLPERPDWLEWDKGPKAQGEWRVKPHHGLTWPMWIMPQAQLKLTVHGPAGCGIRVKLWSQEPSGALKLEQDKPYLLPSQAHINIPLHEAPNLTNQLARLDIEHSQSCEHAITISEAAQLSAPKPTTPNVPPPPPKYVVLWKVDTLRADYLPFHGDPHTYTPAFSALVDKGALFNLAFVQGNESRVSHASLFSGLYPINHGVTPEGKLKDALTLLPEAMKAAGYKTVGRASNGYVSKPYGYRQGWDDFRNELREGYAYNGHAIVDQVTPLIDEHHKAPMFIYVGTVDPHATYRRHDGIFERYDNEPYEGRFKNHITGKNLGEINRRVLEVTPRDKERIKALYRNEITFNDQAFAKLQAHMEKLGIWEDTMVIITSDHGDGFWEHRKVGHGHNSHQELVHVPLIIHYPRAIKSKTVIDAGVDVLDIYPTIMAAIGKTKPEGLQGHSLWPLIHGEHSGYPQPASSNFELKRYTMQLGPYKQILERDGKLHLYDRSHDPLELKDVHHKRPLASRWVSDALSYMRHHRSGWDKSTWGVPGDLSPEFLALSQAHHERLALSLDQAD